MNRRQFIAGAVAAVLAGGGGGGSAQAVGLITQSGARYHPSTDYVYDYYISPTGSNSNDGLTTSTPWALTAINDAGKRALYAGKRVGLMDGTYGLIDIFGQHSGSFDTGVLKLYNTGGSEGSRTVLKAINRHQAIIDFQRDDMTNTDESAALQPTGNYITVDGLKFINSNYRCITNYASGGSYFNVDNCWFEDQVFENVTGSGKNSAGVFMQAKTNNRIRNCYFNLGGAPGDGDRHQWIEFYDTQDTVVEYCTIICNDASITGGRASGIYQKMTDNNNNTYRYNFIDARATSVFCIGMDSGGGTGTATRMHHNVLLSSTAGSGEGGFVRVIYSNADDLHFYNNTCVGGRADPAGFHHLEDGSPDLYWYENIIAPISGFGFGGLYYMGAYAQFQTLDYNLYDSSPAPSISLDAGGGASGLANIQSATGKDANSSTTADPLYAGTGSGADPWRLQSGSPGKTMGPGGTEIGAFSSNNSGPDANGIGYSASRS